MKWPPPSSAAPSVGFVLRRKGPTPDWRRQEITKSLKRNKKGYGQWKSTGRRGTKEEKDDLTERLRGAQLPRNRKLAVDPDNDYYHNDNIADVGRWQTGGKVGGLSSGTPTTPTFH